jgi:hypothetical protein
LQPSEDSAATSTFGMEGRNLEANSEGRKEIVCPLDAMMNGANSSTRLSRFEKTGNTCGTDSPKMLWLIPPRSGSPPTEQTVGFLKAEGYEVG